METSMDNIMEDWFDWFILSKVNETTRERVVLSYL